jgi:hypothetical protein
MGASDVVDSTMSPGCGRTGYRPEVDPAEVGDNVEQEHERNETAPHDRYRTTSGLIVVWERHAGGSAGAREWEVFIGASGPSGSQSL